MPEPTCRKTYKYMLMPTPAQATALDTTLWACRTLYNTALDQRLYVWKTRGVFVSRFTQEA
ncbi:MAG TPA: helix-turn-helix domain-containing protein, partial [Ktedonobacterales bacterium]|nr:helix-turn-helix domain-containing protein [Ktedonobacterales bacterium]